MKITIIVTQHECHAWGWLAGGGWRKRGATIVMQRATTASLVQKAAGVSREIPRHCIECSECHAWNWQREEDVQYKRRAVTVIAANAAII